jgi:hypothetical protein
MLTHCRRSVLMATALVAIFVGPARGADLRVVGSNDSMEISVDIESIKTIIGSHTEVRVLTMYKGLQKLEGVPPFSATLAVLRLRCLTVQGSLSKIVFMSSPEKIVAQYEYPVEWTRVDPKTDVGIVWKYVCTRAWEEDVK